MVGGVIAAALDSRYVSARKDERKVASGILQGPTEVPAVDKAQLVEDVKQVRVVDRQCKQSLQSMCIGFVCSEIGQLCPRIKSDWCSK